MKTLEHDGAAQIVVVALEPGERLLESIEEAIRRHDVRNGVVVSGIGTLRTCHLHCITHTDFPPTNHFWKVEKPLELLSLSGVIADGEPHLHAVISVGEEETCGGHLEPESEVAYLAEVVILKTSALAMKRRLDPKRKISLLGPE